MSDLISKSCLSLALAEYVTSNAYLNQTALDALLMVMRWIREEPAVDAVRVVRCRECEKHRDLFVNADQIYYLVWKTTPRMDGYCYLYRKMDGGAKMAKRDKFDPVTADWIDAHVGVQTTVCKCKRCGLYYKQELGHKCVNEAMTDAAD